MPDEDLMARFRQFRARAGAGRMPCDSLEAGAPRAREAEGDPSLPARASAAPGAGPGERGGDPPAPGPPFGPARGGTAVGGEPLSRPASPPAGGERVPQREDFRLLPGLAELGTEWPSRLAGTDLGPPSRWRWLDLETTGLHGAGVRGFLAAVGRIDGDGVRVRQLLLEDLDREPEFVAAVLAALEGATAVVTFNGKAFDWLLLRDRCIACGLRASWRTLPHWDVLFAARRVYGPWLGRCDLGSLGAALLAEAREGEPSGALIPMLYQAYLQGDRAALDGVSLRNRRDVWVLAGVAARLAAALAGVAERAGGPALRFGLARQFEQLREWERALACYRACLPDGDPEPGARVSLPAAPLFAPARPGPAAGLWAGPGAGLGRGQAPFTRRAAAHAAGRLLKRLGRHEEAAVLWERSRRGPVPSLEAAVEMAKFLEHRRRDPAAALAVVREALRASPWISPQRHAELEHRLARLRRKAASDPHA